MCATFWIGSGRACVVQLNTNQSGNLITGFRIVPETDSDDNIHSCARRRSMRDNNPVREERLHTDESSSTHPVGSSIFDSKLDNKYRQEQTLKEKECKNRFGWNEVRVSIPKSLAGRRTTSRVYPTPKRQ